MTKWSREELADKCFEVAQWTLEAYFNGFLNKEELLHMFENNCTSEGREENADYTHKILDDKIKAIDAILDPNREPWEQLAKIREVLDR